MYGRKYGLCMAYVWPCESLVCGITAANDAALARITVGYHVLISGVCLVAYGAPTPSEMLLVSVEGNEHSWLEAEKEFSCVKCHFV